MFIFTKFILILVIQQLYALDFSSKLTAGFSHGRKNHYVPNFNSDPGSAKCFPQKVEKSDNKTSTAMEPKNKMNGVNTGANKPADVPDVSKKPEEPKKEEPEDEDTVKLTGCGDLNNKTVTITADNGKLLSVCTDCGNATYHDSISINGKAGDPRTIFEFKTIDDKCSIKASNKKYIARCGDCWEDYNLNGLFAHVTELGVLARWVIYKKGNKYLMQGDNQNFIARCTNCTKSDVTDFAMTSASKPEPLAEFTIRSV